MQKIISTALVLCLLLGVFAMPAFADGGYGESYDTVDDNLDDAEQEDLNTVFLNDFEGVTGFADTECFKIVDTGDKDHQKALYVWSNTWEEAPRSGHYNYGGKTFAMFKEPLVKNQNYILEYDYTSEKLDKAPADYPFSFCPVYDQFWMGNDHRDYPVVHTDGNWYHHAVAFTAEKDTIDLKLNTCATNIHSYIDNIRVRKAIKVSANGAVLSDVFKLISGSPVENSKVEGMIFPSGTDLSFTLKANSMEFTVMNGDKELLPDSNGVYRVFNAASDINIAASMSMDSLKKLFPIANDTIYIPAGVSINYIASALSLSNSDIFSAIRNGTELKKDNELKPNDVLTVKMLDSGKTDTYKVKLLGDYNGDGIITVTDLVGTVDLSLNAASAAQNISQDINVDGRITVTDIVRIREMILNASDNIAPNDNVISAIDKFTRDTISKSGVTVTEKNLEQSIFNTGDRTRVANVIKKAMRGEKIVLSTFGGSITQGAGCGTNPSNFKHYYASGDIRCYAEVLADWFRDTFKSYGATVELHNAGIGATDTPYGIHRMGEDVLAYNPDLVIIEWDMNDQPEKYRQATYEFMMRKLLKEDIAVVMLAMAGSQSMGTQYLHEPLSTFYDVPYISYGDAFSGESYFKDLTNDTVHPNIVGHHLTAMLLANYFGNVYKDIDNIGFMTGKVIDAYYSSDTASYGENPYIATFSDIEAGKVSGVRMVSRGSFQKETNQTSFAFRKYYGYTAKYAESYQPMVLEVDKCQTLFLQIMRSYGMRDASFYVEINGEKVTDSSFTCSHSAGADSSQIENQYHWATRRAFYKDGGEKLTVKIYPTNKKEQEYVKLFALLLS